MPSLYVLSAAFALLVRQEKEKTCNKGLWIGSEPKTLLYIERKFSVLYNSGLIFIVLAIIPIGNNNIVLDKSVSSSKRSQTGQETWQTCQTINQV